ncbi:CHAT domain-containing protein [Mariprofundus erugo]|uniref:CHAT domain-containing tetratricopeptide repeat protein n=1 Tax=Mariprofundus erugo TaxID=2528639 RepID=UPI0010FDE9A0|nr:CHAT domain-containing tetratricopeptide repeat protein [Mariprofundus erugo]TLS78250.1 CHAT domain-containing protein [Mariprofundus erugo]
MTITVSFLSPLARGNEVGDLNNRVMKLIEQGHYSEALPLAIRTAELEKSRVGEDHPNYAIDLSNIAFLYNKLGQFEQALPLYRQSLAIQKRLGGDNTPAYATGLNNLAALHDKMGNYDQALPLYQQVLNIRKKVPGDAHPSYAVSLNNLAELYRQTGEYHKALPLYEQATAIWAKDPGPESAQYAIGLSNFADLHHAMGHYSEALRLHGQALEIYRHALGDAHPAYGSGLGSIAALYLALGDYDKALPLYRQAADIFAASLGKDHPAYAQALNSLAALYDDMGDYDKALPLYQQALEIRSKVLGEQHPAYATSLGNLALLYLELDDAGHAEPLAVESARIRKASLGDSHPDYAKALGIVALIFHKMGENDRALALYREVADRYKRSLGESHPTYADALNNLAFTYGGLHNSSDALSQFVAGQNVAAHLLGDTFPALTEQQKLRFVQKLEWGYFGMLSLIHSQLAGDASAVRAGLDAVLSRKGIVFDAQARQQEAIAKSLDADAKRLWQDLESQRSMLAKLMQTGFGKMQAEQYQSRVKEIQERIATLEGQLAGKSALVAEEMKQRSVTSKEVAQALGRDAALVECVKIQDYDWGKGKWADTRRYLAFVLKGDGSVKLVDLGDETKLEATARQAVASLAHIGGSGRDQDAASQRLYASLWEPVASAVGRTGKVVFSPDGVLNLVPFAAMQASDGSYLIERMQVSYVTSGRDLAKGDPGIRPESELYLAADPQFDLAGLSTGEASASRGATRSAGFAIQFERLPGTEAEAKMIPAYLQGTKSVVTGKEATELSVLSVRRPKVMHLATHGFFLQDQPEFSAGTRGGKAIQHAVADVPQALPKGYENPLVRSGLAFAGANHAGETQGDRDGLLTALEVSGMDLHGTDLVTLSACETGRGEIKSGEGVFGLRRAFALAGARNLIMSLWPVSDEVTATQMQVLYREYGNGSTPARALRQAQLATIGELRQRNSYASPALWAPFIVQGGAAR